MKCGFAVCFRSHKVAPVRSQRALNSGMETSAQRHCQAGYSVNTGGGSKGNEALRRAACGSQQLRRLSCSGSAAMAVIVPSIATGGGSGGQQQASVSVRLQRRTVAGGHPVVPVKVAINTALPNPSLKRSPNGVARRPSSAGPAAHSALAVQRVLQIGRAHV